MQFIEQHPYAEQVLPLLPGNAGVGETLADDDSLGFLEDEVMKMGSLAHTGMDWFRIESESLKLLADRSKHLKVLGFLMLCLQRGGDGERFALSLFLLHRVLDSWWDSAWPFPGDRGRRARTMLFSQILQRAAKGVDGLSFDATVGDGHSYCLDLVGKLTAQAVHQQLPDDGLFELERALKQLPRESEALASSATPEPAASTPVASQKDTARPAVSSSPVLGGLILDPGNERATRQSLLKVADLMAANNPANPLAFQVRRYAIWLGISSLPPTRDGRRTELAAVSADRVAEYREALATTPDTGVWQRIEQSLSVSPFWLDGHWLSARVAAALGHGCCAEAIHGSLKEFVERLPQLAELTFSDGSPFLGPDAADWLWTSGVEVASESGSASPSPWEQAYERALELARQQKLADAMQCIEDGLAGAREPRDRLYWQLASARLLKQVGLTSMATQQARDLQRQVHGMMLEDWEPSLMKQLERLA